jgi:hypothetical protein
MIIQQNQTKMELAEADNFLERYSSTNNFNYGNNSNNNITPVKGNLSDDKMSDSESSLQGKKRSRDRMERFLNKEKEDESLKFKCDENTEKNERGIDVEVKLICDLPNEDMKKAFTKSVRNLSLCLIIDFLFLF